MKHSRKICVAVATVAVLALAVWALAGYLMDDGDVIPDIGWKNETEFLYSVTYWLSPAEDPPDVVVIGYWGGHEQWREMMGVAWIMTPKVHYEYKTKLPETGEWSFQFQVIGGELSITYLGPWVYNRP